MSHDAIIALGGMVLGAFSLGFGLGWDAGRRALARELPRPRERRTVER